MIQVVHELVKLAESRGVIDTVRCQPSAPFPDLRTCPDGRDLEPFTHEPPPLDTPMFHGGMRSTYPDYVSTIRPLPPAAHFQPGDEVCRPVHGPGGIWIIGGAAIIIGSGIIIMDGPLPITDTMGGPMIIVGSECLKKAA